MSWKCVLFLDKNPSCASTFPLGAIIISYTISMKSSLYFPKLKQSLIIHSDQLYFSIQGVSKKDLLS